MVVRALEKFIKHEASSGVILLMAAILALVISNSALAGYYDSFFHAPWRVQLGPLVIEKTVNLWINDGLMAIFFLLVGLEIKREVMRGQLSSREQIVLPAMAAFGGMAVPALVFVVVTGADPATINGWAIPAATDIAFALGVLALLGSRAPLALKVFLLAVAIIDDLGAIIIIAAFYTENLSVEMLVGAGVAIAALTAMNLGGVRRTWLYIAVGAVLWVFVLKSGVHATLAGVALAFAIPISSGGVKDEPGHSPLEKMEHTLHPWVAYLIMPVFAFANAGVPLIGLGAETFLSPLTLGIALGLFIGKQIGVFGLAWIAVKSGMAKLPEGVGWAGIYGAGCLAGIGFTMSLFIGGLAFTDSLEHEAAVRIGVLSGSLLSAVMGFMILRMTTSPSQARPATAGAS